MSERHVLPVPLRRLLVGLTVAAMVAVLLPTAAWADHAEVLDDDGLVASVRWAGGTRYDTAAKLGVEFTGSVVAEPATAAILATGEAFPDALAGAYLAGATGSPVLLTRRDEVPDETMALLTGSSPTSLGEVDTIYLLGGPVAIAPSVETALKDEGYTVERLAGADRAETAAVIATDSPGATPGSVDGLRTAILATSQQFPDALVAGAASAAASLPLLLTDVTSIPPSSLDALDELDVQQVVIAGGPVAVSVAVESQLRDAGYTIRRVAGGDRDATAVDFARFNADEFGFSTDAVGLARNDNFPDALAFAPFAGRERISITLTPTAALSATTSAYLESIASCRFDTLYVPGGTDAVSAATEAAAREALTTDEECSGVDNTDPTIVSARIVRVGTAASGTSSRVLPGPDDGVVEVVWSEPVDCDGTDPGQFRYIAGDGTVTTATSLECDRTPTVVVGFPGGVLDPDDADDDFQYIPSSNPSSRITDLAGNAAGVALATVEPPLTGGGILVPGEIRVNSAADQVDADPSDEVCDTGDLVAGDSGPEPECTLRAAIQTANVEFNRNQIFFAVAGLDIELSVGTPGDATAASGDLDITDSVSITGNDTTITTADGFTDRAFDIGVPNGFVDDVNISGLTIIGFDLEVDETGAEDRGGALRATDTRVSLFDMALTDNSAPEAGGAIEATRALLEMRAVVVSDNTTGSGGQAGNGGGIHAVDSGIGWVSSNGAVNTDGASVASGNTANEGGAIWLSGRAGVFSADGLDGVDFTGNVAVGAATVVDGVVTDHTGGGAIYVQDGGSLLVMDAVFADNLAEGADASGGAVLVDDGFVQLGSANTTARVTGGAARRGGGAVAVFGPEGGVTLKNYRLDDNGAGSTDQFTDGLGGALHVDGGATATLETGVIESSTAGQGGGIWIGDGTVDLGPTDLIGNRAASDDGATAPTPVGGGAIYVGAGGGLTMFRNAVFSQNQATSTAGGALGGAVLVDGGDAAIAGSNDGFTGTRTVSGNRAQIGGAFAVTGGGDLRIAKVALRGNVAERVVDGDGLGGAVANLDGTFTVSEGGVTNVDDNRAADRGGAFYTTGAGTLALRSVFLGLGTGPNYAVTGGAIFNDGGTVDLERINSRSDGAPITLTGAGGREAVDPLAATPTLATTVVGNVYAETGDTSFVATGTRLTDLTSFAPTCSDPVDDILSPNNEDDDETCFPEPVTTLTVDTAVDAVDATPGNETCEIDGGGCSLRAAISEVLASDVLTTVEIADGIDPTLSIPGADEANNASGDLDITQDLTIVGLGDTCRAIDAAGIDRVLDVDVATLELENVTLNGGDATGLGGALRIDGSSDVTMTNCSIVDNAASDGGGGVALSAGGAFTATDVSFDSNEATGVAADGGAIHNDDGTVTLTRGSADGNRAARDGGAFWTTGDATFAVTDTALGLDEGPNVASRGGAFHNQDGAFNLSGVDAGSLGGNLNSDADDTAGGLESDTPLAASPGPKTGVVGNVYSQAGPAPSVFVTNTTFTDADDVEPTCSENIDDRETGASGNRDDDGTCFGPEPVVVDLTINSTADVADLDPTDGVCDTGNDVFNVMLGTVDECTLRAAIQTSNATTDTETITFVGASSYRLTITDDGNDDAASGDLDITDDVVIRGGDFPRTIFSGDGYTERAFDAAGATVAMSGVFLTNFSLPVDASGSQDRGGAVRVTGGSFSLEDSSFENVAAPEAGGAIEAVDATVTLTDTTIRNARTGSGSQIGNGGAIHGVNADVSVVRETLETLAVDDISANEGGAFWVRGGSLTVAGVTSSRTDAVGDSASLDDLTGGGFVFADGGADVTITDSTIGNAKATGVDAAGGAILIDQADLTIGVPGADTDTTSINGVLNRATRGASIAVVGENATATIASVDVESGEAASDGTSSTPADGLGGVLYVEGADVDVQFGTWSEGDSVGARALDGGAIYADGGLLTIDGTTIRDAISGDSNVVGSGGTVHVTGGAIVDVHNATIAENSSVGPGGAIRNDASTVTIGDPTVDADVTTFTSNTTQAVGGAITTVGGTLTSHNSVFLSNRAAFGPVGHGGAVHSVDSTTTIVGGSADDNRAVLGGAFYASGALPLTLDGVELGLAVDGGPNWANNGGAIHNDGGATVFDDLAAGSFGNLPNDASDDVPGGLETTNLFADDPQPKADNVFGNVYAETGSTTSSSTNSVFTDQDETLPTCSNAVDQDAVTSGNTDDDGTCAGEREVVLNIITVNTNADKVDATPENGVCDTGVVLDPGTQDERPECSLRAAVQTANVLEGGDRIEFEGSYTITPTLGASGNDDPASGDLDITERLEVVGFVEIDGSSSPDRIFDVADGVRVDLVNVRINNVTLTDDPTGNEDRGGAIRIGENARVDTVKLSASGNVAPGGGGAIEAKLGSTLTLTNPSIAGGSASGEQAARGGGIYAVGASVTVTDDEDNFAGLFSLEAQEGGAIWLSGGSLTVDRADLSSNTATATIPTEGSPTTPGGGAVHAEGGAVVTLLDVSLAGNNAPNGFGGDVLAIDARVEVGSDGGATDTTTFTGSASRGGGVAIIGDASSGRFDSADFANVFVDDPTIGSFNADGLGGGMYVSGGDVEVTGGTISSSSAQQGAGVYATGGADVTLDGATVANNTPSGDGGPLAGGTVFVTGGATVDVHRSTFADNDAGSFRGAFGAAILVDGGTLFVGDAADDGDVTTFSGNRAFTDGGAIHVSTSTGPSTVTIRNAVFFNNRADSENDSSGGAINNDGSTVTVIGGNADDNRARFGGAFATTGAGTFRVEGTELGLDTSPSGGQNWAAEGGAFYNDGGTFAFVDVAAGSLNGTPEDASNHLPGGQESGDPFRSSPSVTGESNAQFGHVYAVNNAAVSTASATGSVFTDALGDRPTCEVNVDPVDPTTSGNASDDDLCFGPQPLSFSINTNQDIIDQTPGDGRCNTGGPLINNEPECSLRAAIMEANASDAEAFLDLRRTTYTLSLGSAGDDAAASGDLDVTTDITINGDTSNRNSVIAGSTGTAVDRAFDVNGATLTLNDVALTGHAVPVDDGGNDDRGGAIRVRNGANLVLNGNTDLNNNAAPEAGGAIEVDATSTLTATNASFTGNTTGSDAEAGNGGAVHNDGGTVTMTFESGTFHVVQSNEAVQGGAFWTTGAGVFTIDGDTNFNNNKASSEGGLFYNEGGTFAFVDVAIGVDSGNEETDDPDVQGNVYAFGGIATASASGSTDFESSAPGPTCETGSSITATTTTSGTPSDDDGTCFDSN